MDDTPSLQPLVSRIHCTSNLKSDLERAVEAIGGWDWFCREDAVLVKPNYNSPHPPPGSTAPDFLRSTLQLLQEHGAETIFIGESTSYSNHRKVLEQTGVYQVAQDMKVQVVIFDEDGWENVVVGGQYLKRVKLARLLSRGNRIVYLCCPKTHHAAQFTGSLKLGMGFVNNWQRTLWHFGRLQEKIVDLNLVIKPDLILADLRRTFITGGPATGELREPGLLMASRNRIAIDAEAIKVIQGFPGHNLPPTIEEVVQIKRAIELGLGPEEGLFYRTVVR
ncbi:MAG: DUF362 domain-containing protein [Anaerolineales bacterium]|nr:DUF362 domain-containing protein [Anaerolineales bacterium]